MCSLWSLVRWEVVRWIANWNCRWWVSSHRPSLWSRLYSIIWYHNRRSVHCNWWSMCHWCELRCPNQLTMPLIARQLDSRNRIWSKRRKFTQAYWGRPEETNAYRWILETALIVQCSIDVTYCMIQNAFRSIIAATEGNIVQCFWISGNHFDPCAPAIGHNIDSCRRFMVARRFNRKVNALNTFRLWQYLHQIRKMY